MPLPWAFLFWWVGRLAPSELPIPWCWDCYGGIALQRLWPAEILVKATKRVRNCILKNYWWTELTPAKLCSCSRWLGASSRLFEMTSTKEALTDICWRLGSRGISSSESPSLGSLGVRLGAGDPRESGSWDCCCLGAPGFWETKGFPYGDDIGPRGVRPVRIGPVVPGIWTFRFIAIANETLR